MTGSLHLPLAAPSTVDEPAEGYRGFMVGDGTEGTTEGLLYLTAPGESPALIGGPVYTDEAAQDAVGAMVDDTATVSLTYTDATPALTADVIDGSITNAKLADMDQALIKGRAAAAGTGDPTDLTASQVKTILAYEADEIAVTPFGTIEATTLQAALEEIAAESGGSPTAAGTSFTPYGSVAATNVQAAIQEILDEGGGGYDNEQAQDAIGGILADTATVNLTYTDATPAITADVIDDSITNAKLANVATATIKGRITAGTGDLEDLTGAQALTVIGGAPLASPTFTGTPAAPTASVGTNSTQIATTAYVDRELQTNSQTGTTYTLVLADASKVVECTNASAVALVVPPNSSVAFPVGTVIEIYQGGAGLVTVGPGSGVTIRAFSGSSCAGQYASVGLRKRATDEWVLTGGVA